MDEPSVERERAVKRFLKSQSNAPAALTPSLFAKAIVYLKVNCNLAFPNIALRLAPQATPETFEHDSENVYEWMWLNIKDVPFALNVSREHGWADIDDETESTASMEELKTLVKPGAIYMAGWERSTDTYINELPEWLPQFVADELDADVYVFNGRINVDIPDGKPVAVVHPRPGNANNI